MENQNTSPTLRSQIDAAIQYDAESLGMTVRGFLKSRLEQGRNFGEIAREVGAKNRVAINLLCRRHGLHEGKSA